ncbi:MAG: hypothetical protein RI953_2478 [Pseudomonadota bacterium]
MYKTRRRALLIDHLSTGLITTVGLSVILAVAGMMLFLVFSSWPLFKKESLQSIGSLNELDFGANDVPGELLFDDNAPIGFILPGAGSTSCAIRVRSVENAENQKSSPVSNSVKYRQYYLLTKNAASASDTGSIPLSLFQADERTTLVPSNQNQLECSAQGDGRWLIRDGQSLRAGRTQFIRSFLTSEELRELSTQVRQALKENRWAIVGQDILVKPSAQSPSAKLTLQHDLEWSLPDFFSKNPSTQLKDIRFVHRPGKKDGVIVVSGSPQAPVRYSLLSIVENEITGEKTTTNRELDFSSTVEPGNPLAKLDPVWIEGRYLLMVDSSTSLQAFDLEDAQLLRVKLSTPESLGRLTNMSGNFGGASVFSEFTADAQQRCASLDAGRAIRLAANSPQLSGELPVLWSDVCEPSIRLMPHPHHRAVYRWLGTVNEGLQNSVSSGQLEVRELTTGRVAVKTKVAPLAWRTAIADVKGNLIGWNNPEQKRLELIRLVAPHLEVSLQSLFSKIRYESYENASYSWQSTSGNDEFQSKFSLIPLIWGTIKATLYSLLFAVPLAIFAAVYSSEILDRQTRNVVKPTLEMMASVPSVVLGFLAAIIIAPWIETHILSVLLIGVAMPFMLYAAGVFMQIPSARHLTTRGLYASRRLLVWVIFGFAILIWLLGRAGLWIERTAFGGDLKAFLSGGPGTEGVLWGLLMLPLIFIGLWSLPIRRARNWYRISVFFLGPVLSVWLGSLFSGHTTLRDDVLGTYAQRNTLVIAIAMGFAIIPIIYSLAEDALTSVPASLRAGSLACGASVWQTTARVVLPTAASGLFSAIMVGLGRGIGETMIAVMATGNTAVMTLNPFDGLRSMAANIAVELPEAAQGSTHYRILFLSALVLFMFTFTLNSFAEFLRARYRARNKAL